MHSTEGLPAVAGAETELRANARGEVMESGGTTVVPGALAAFPESALLTLGFRQGISYLLRLEVTHS